MGYPSNPVVSDIISTSGAGDTYATHWAKLGLGGARSENTLADRNAITTARREFGMICYVTADPTPANNGPYVLCNVALGGVDNVLTNNSNWKPLTSGSSFQLGASVDGLGSLLQTGSIGFSVAKGSGTIQSWSIIGDTTGSIVMDVKRNGTSIVGAGNMPTITTAVSATANVSGWTSTAIVEGDFIEFSITSVTSFTRINLFIKVA